MFATVGGGLRARVNVSLVRKGYQVAGEKIDAQAADALVALLILLGTALWARRYRRGRAQRKALERETL